MNRIFGMCAMALLFCSQATRVAAQEPSKDAKPAADAKAGEAKSSEANPPKEESFVTDHTIRIGGQTIAYKATASTTLLKDEKGEPTALIYSTAYTQSDVKDFSQRPIAFIYNGGPGSSSVWLHMGAFGPRRVVNSNADVHAACAVQNRRQREFPARQSRLWCSSIPSAPALAAQWEKRRTRISGAWTRT